MSYGRMRDKGRQLSDEVKELLAQAEAVDAAEDAEYGADHGDELPAELQRRESRLQRIREAKRALETRAKAEAAVYARRKTMVEPVLGQIKQARGFRQFLLRGVAKVQGEWALVCTTHNILKLYRLCA